MKLIKTPEDHAAALRRFDVLASRGDDLTAKQQDELEHLLLLIQDYERKHHPVPPPTPVEAIRFRMEQMGYKQKDLAVLVGGSSRASEILSGKRGLTPAMMRRLRDEWGIPADSLLGTAADDETAETPAGETKSAPAWNPDDFPVRQMFDHGYFVWATGAWKQHRGNAAGLLSRFLRGRDSCELQPILCRQGGGAKADIHPHALEAWRWRVLQRAAETKDRPAFDMDELDEEFIEWLCALSPLPEGPRLACEALEGIGIPVIVQPRLDHTHLDGAAMLDPSGRPVIGITLRHNRFDNFWFTLLHELGHVRRHLSPDKPALFDSDIDRRKTGRVEAEADRFALDALIPSDVWESEIRHLTTSSAIRAAAKRLRRSPSILAGRLRREANDYRKHPQLVGNGELRAVFGFTGESWPK